MMTSEFETAPVGKTADPARFIVASRHDVLARLVDALMRGASFLALTGLPGVGKTTMATAVQELLAARSVAALRVGRGESGAIRLRTLAAQLLGKPEDAVDDGDAERLFDIMTAHRPSDRRRVIILDDAQLVHTEVLAYLRLLISLGIEPGPQFLFVGNSSFWRRAAEAAHANVRDLITDWVDLEPLTSAESREFVELLLGSAGPATGAALDRAALDELVCASHGLIGRLASLLAGAAATPDDVPREFVADPRPDDATAVASGEADDVSRSEHDAGRLPEDVVPAHDRPGPEVTAALFGSQFPAHGSSRPRRVPVFASVAGVLMLAGLVGAVAYWRILVPSEHGARAASATIIEASSDGVHPTPPDAAANVEIIPSARAAAIGGREAHMAPTASTTATARAVTPPAQSHGTVSAASLTALSPGAGLPDETRVFSADAAVTKAAGGVENPQAGEMPPAPSSEPALPATTSGSEGSSAAVVPVDATAVPTVAPPEGPSAPAVPAAAPPEDQAPTAATGLPSQAGAENTDTPTVRAIAQPAAASPSKETEPPSFAAQPPATPAASTDAANAGANEAGPPAGAQLVAPSQAGDDVVPLPVVSPPAASPASTDAVNAGGNETGSPEGTQSAASPAGDNVAPLPAGSPPAAPSASTDAADAGGNEAGSPGGTQSAASPAGDNVAPLRAVSPPAASPASTDAVNAGGNETGSPAGTQSAASPAGDNVAPLPAGSPSAAPLASTDAVNAGANEAGPSAGTQSAASPAGDNVAPLPVVSPPAAPPASTDAVNAGGNEAGSSAGTQSAASPAGDDVAPLPVVSPSAAPPEPTDAADTDARAGSATVQSAAPSSAGQSGPPASDPSPPAAPSNAVKSGATGLDTGPTAASVQPSASVPAPTEAAPPVTSIPAAAPEVPASGAAAAEPQVLPAAMVQPAAAPPAAQSQAATTAAATVATPSKPPSTTAASSQFVPPDLGSLLIRGDAMLALGDISAARLLYERAAALGSAKAATALGKTYDPAFLASIQVSGLTPNPAAAASWYRKGADLGDAEAADRLTRLAKAH